MGLQIDHSCVSYDKVMAKYVVSMSNLNKMVPDSTPRISPKAFEEKIASEAMKPKVSISQADDDDEDEKQSLEDEKIVDQENQHQVKKNGDTVISSQLLGVF